MNNSSSLTDPWSNLPGYLVYILQGSLIGIGNIVIILSIIRFEALRNTKEYILVLGLAVADAMNLAAYFFAGVYRIRLLMSGEHQGVATVWDCMTTVHCFLWATSWIQSQLMLTVISADRLLCVSFPLAYIGWTTHYARTVVGVAWLLGLSTTAFIVGCAALSSAEVRATCSLNGLVPAITPSAFVPYFEYAPEVYAALSVIMYAIVLVLYRRSNMIVAPSGHPNQQYELKRQRKVTVTLAISALCTLSLFSIPSALARNLYSVYYTLAIVCFSIATLNPLANIFLYPMRQKEMKQALKALVTCKKMPERLKDWNVQFVGIEMQERDRAANQLVPRGPRVAGERRALAKAESQ